MESFVILNAARGCRAVHEEAKREEAKQRRTPEQIAYIPEETEALVGLGVVNREQVGAALPRPANRHPGSDATIIESRKQEVLPA